MLNFTFLYLVLKFFEYEFSFCTYLQAHIYRDIHLKGMFIIFRSFWVFWDSNFRFFKTKNKASSIYRQKLTGRVRERRRERERERERESGGARERERECFVISGRVTLFRAAFHSYWQTAERNGRDFASLERSRFLCPTFYAQLTLFPLLLDDVLYPHTCNIVSTRISESWKK